MGKNKKVIPCLIKRITLVCFLVTMTFSSTSCSRASRDEKGSDKSIEDDTRELQSETVEGVQFSKGYGILSTGRGYPWYEGEGRCGDFDCGSESRG